VTGIEWLFGAWILSGWRLAMGVCVALALNAGYAAWMTLSIARGLDLANCGCYGMYYPQPLRWYSPLKDLVLVGMCYALHKFARKNVAAY